MKNFRNYFFGILFSMFFIFQACKLRNLDNTTLQDENQKAADVRSKITPQYVVKSRMIFKFYCQPNEKIPDCEDYDVMRVESFLEAAGFSDSELKQYSEYAALKKARDKATKALETLEASYKAAIEKKEKKGKVLPAQELDYQRMKKFYASEIKRFEDSSYGAVWMKARDLMIDSSDIEKYFSAEVGEIESGRHHTCALKLNGDVICWGDDEHRQVSGWREKVANGELKTPVKQIGVGLAHTCALASDGKISCWGKDNEKQTSGWRERVASGELTFPILEVGAGWYHTCALSSDRGISCWGKNDLKQSSDWKNEVMSGELTIPIRHIIAGDFHNCVKDSDGRINCWGWDEYKQSLGWKEKVENGELKTPVRQISAGYWHSCAIGSDGRMSCWGNNEDKQSSGWKEKIERGDVKTPIRQTSAGFRHSCAIGSDGGISCWGDDSSRNQSSGWIEKVEKGELKLPASQISAGYAHTCAIDSRRRAVCWGFNGDGQVNGRNESGYKIGDYTPEDFATELVSLGYYEE